MRDALSAIWAARHGLAEAELLDLLGRDGAPLPRAHWSPLYLAADRSLVSHSGLLGFFHDYLRQAVRERYLPTPAQQHEAHLRLADYFAPRDLSARKIAELPWQLAQAQAWERLAEVLAELPFVSAAWNQSNYDVRSYWSQVDERIPGAPLQAYQPVFDEPNRHIEYFHLVSLLLLRLNYPEQSGRLQSYLFQTFDQLDIFDADAFISLSIDSAANAHAQGKLDTALSMIRQAVTVGRRPGHRPALAGAIANEATYLASRARWRKRSRCSTRPQSLARETGNKSLLGELINNRLNCRLDGTRPQALVALADLERLPARAGRQGHLERLSRQPGQRPDATGQARRGLEQVPGAGSGEPRDRVHGRGAEGAVAPGPAARIAPRRRRRLELLAQQEAICRRIGNRNSLAQSLLLQATLTLKYRHDPAARRQARRRA